MESSSNEAPSACWRLCRHCPQLRFDAFEEFERHVREKHCMKEGSMVLCHYGENGLCAALQFGDLSEDGFRYHVRRHHLTIDAGSDNWTFFSSSQNLPAVLNDPNRGKQSNFFTKTWGDHFVEKIDISPSPHLPLITLAHFESYCKKISRRLRRHCRLKENTIVKPQPIVTIREEICEVPFIFYQQSLPLKNTEIFQKVFPNLCESADAVIAIRLLQESLSNYLDVIEMKISKQVALKSDAFFHAMLSHDTIMEQMNSAVKLVRQTRENITQTKEKLGEKPLQLVKLTRCRTNFNNVYEQLKLMSTVQQTQPMIQLLLSTSDYVAALDLISSTQKVLSSHLTGVHAFRHLSPQLTEMERLINKMLNNEFQRFAVTDLNRPLADLGELPEKDKLVSIISGILRLKELDFIDTFKGEAITTIQTTVKQLLIEIISEREGNVEIVLRGSGADNTWLACSEGIVFLQRASPALINLLRRISVIVNLILEVSQMDDLSSTQSEDFWTVEEQKQIKEKLRKMIWSLSDYCNERCANLLVTKSEKENVLADFDQLSTMSKLIDDFSFECESITGHCSSTLKLALRSFSMKFIQNLHNERRNKLATSINTERWKLTDVPFDIQHVVDEICKHNEIPPKIPNVQSNKPDAKFLVINNENFATVETVQLLIRIILEYCEVASQSPIIVQYVTHCLLELIRLFNSRCCQLVLGAGALQSAGLKTITTSNLALVSRSLQVVLWLLPIVRRLLTTVQSGELHLNSFDTLQNDIRSHKEEIENKIYNIVSHLLTSQLTSWDARPPVPSQTFRNISKHLVKLHEALSNILPLGQIQCIYKRVHDNFKDKLREQLIGMNIVANGGPQHGVVTSELTFYLQTLRTLKVVADNDIEDSIFHDIWIQ